MSTSGLHCPAFHRERGDLLPVWEGVGGASGNSHSGEAHRTDSGIPKAVAREWRAHESPREGESPWPVLVEIRTPRTGRLTSGPTRIMAPMETRLLPSRRAGPPAA